MGTGPGTRSRSGKRRGAPCGRERNVFAWSRHPRRAALQEKKKPDEQDQHQHGERTVGRRFAEAELTETQLVDARGKDGGRVQRTAPASDVDDVEIVEGQDRRQQHVHHRDRKDRGQRHIDQAAELAGAVDRRRFDLLLIDVLERGQEHDGRERKPFPEGGEDDRGHGGRRIGQPADALVDQTQPDEERIDEAELRVVHEAPQNRRHHPRKHPWEKHKRAQRALERQTLVEQKRDQKTADVLQEHDPGCPYDRIAHDLPESLVAEDPAIGLQSDKGWLGIDEGRRVEALAEGVDHWPVHEHGDEDRGGGHRSIGHPAVGLAPPWRRTPRGRGARESEAEAAAPVMGQKPWGGGAGWPPHLRLCPSAAHRWRRRLPSRRRRSARRRRIFCTMFCWISDTSR